MTKLLRQEESTVLFHQYLRAAIATVIEIVIFIVIIIVIVIGFVIVILMPEKPRIGIK